MRSWRGFVVTSTQNHRIIILVNIIEIFKFWCNGPLKGCSHGLQVDVGTLVKNEDNDTLSSD